MGNKITELTPLTVGQEASGDLLTIVDVSDTTMAATGTNKSLSPDAFAKGSELTAHEDDVANPHSVTKTQLSLGNVDNTSDANKPVSTAQQTEINTKEDDLGTPGGEGWFLASTVAGVRSWVASSAGVAWGAITGTLSDQTDLQTALNAKATASDLTTHEGDTSNPHSVTKTQVSLGNADNTSDVNKPVSTAQQTEINTKEDDLGNPASDGRFLASTMAGVRSWVASSAGVAWGAITGTLSDQTDLQTALNAKATASDLTTHEGDQTNPHVVTKTQVSLGNVDNTSDASKPVSTAQQTALNLKADDSDLSTHEGDTSNPHSVTKTQVSLGNADNTSDASKPVSTATQTALNLKSAITTVGITTGSSISITNFWAGTQASYDAITTPDTNTIYFIT